MTLVRRVALLLLLVATAVVAAGGPSSAGSGRAPGTGMTVIWAVGDAADQAGAGRRLADRIVADGPGLLLYLGDVYERGTAEEFSSYYEPLYGRIATRTAPTPGNHEWGLRDEGYFPYWRSKLGRRLPSYYRLSRSGWEILSLNSEAAYEAGSSQQRWLRRQLERRTTCRLAFMHRPRFSAGLAHGDSPDLAPLWDEFPGRVRLALAAHEHNSQRLAVHRGVLSLVAGAGGRELHPVNEDDPRLVFGNDDDIAGLRMELSPGRLRYRFVREDGALLHGGAVRCR